MVRLWRAWIASFGGWATPEESRQLALAERRASKSRRDQINKANKDDARPGSDYNSEDEPFKSTEEHN